MLVETTPAYFHHLTKQGNGIGLSLLPDEVESHFDSLAKKAVAFFNISRSMRRRLFSSRSLFISSCLGVMRPLPGKAAALSFSNSLIHLRRTLIINLPAASSGVSQSIDLLTSPQAAGNCTLRDELTPKFRDASLARYPCSVTRFTASCLNSREYIFLIFGSIGHPPF